jgi:hypothetical protein
MTIQMWESVCVGAGLLANAVCQSMHLLLIHRIREQARSHTSSLNI